MTQSLIVALLALAVERFAGYPDWLFRRISHPVVWIGALIAALDARLNRPAFSPARGKLGGIVTVVAIVAVTLLVTLPLQWALRQFAFGWIGEGLLATAFLAQHHLGRAVRAVAEALQRSLPKARTAVSYIVGRDTTVLDEAGVARAAVETLAENSSDGVIAPLFWLALFGLPGAAAYKAINTADSMIGHLDARYRDFGWAAARLDDLVNLIPARLTALLLALAAAIVAGASGSAALATALRDASKHRSPNAGWPEAAMAGALGFALGGPRAYGGEIVDLPTMGGGRAELTRADIGNALRLYGVMLTLAFVLVALLATLASTV